MRTAHAVTLGVWLRTGSQDETAGLGGVSHFLEHMVFKGTQQAVGLRVAATFDRLGASVDAFTTKDLVAFTIKVLPEYFERGGGPAGARCCWNPPSTRGWSSWNRTWSARRSRRPWTPPRTACTTPSPAASTAATPAAGPSWARPASVRSFSSGPAARTSTSACSRRPNLVISMAGNILEGFHEIVAETFAGPDRTGPAGPGLCRRGSRAAAAAAVIDLDLDEADPFRLDLISPIIQTYFEIGNLGIPFHHEDRMPVFLLTNMLGGGMSSRIFQAVREREGLAYTVYNYSDMGRDIGLVSCAGSCSPDKLDRLEDVIRMEYCRLISEGVTAEELENNRAQIKSQLIFSLEGMVNQMFRAARNEIFYGRFLPVSELVDQIDAVGVDDIVRCAETYFNPDSLLVAVHGPEPCRDNEL